MLFGLFFILTAWLVPGLPLWYSIICTVFGALRIITHAVMFADANNNN